MTRTGRWMSLLVAAIAATSIACVATPAAAQKKKGGVIRLGEMTIEGRVQKPNAFFLSTRTALVFEAMELHESFVDEIPKVVDSGEL